MNISAYILEYLKQFGSVTVPGFGVFSLGKSKAIINSENGSILPPASQIAFVFNDEVKSDDLSVFISAQEQRSPQAAATDLKIQTDFWKKKLQAEHQLEIQHLGTAFLDNGTVSFKGNRLAADHPDFYGLEEIILSDIHTAPEKKALPANPEKDYRLKKSILWIFLLIIPVLGLIYLAYAQSDLLFGKKSFNEVSVQTKTHRIVEDTIKIQVHAPQVADSLKKDSLKKDSAILPAAKNLNTKTKTTKATWQK